MTNFPGFTEIFILFNNDDEIKRLSFEEKHIIFTNLQNIPFVSYRNFILLKEYILKSRALNHPTMDITNIRKIINRNNIVDCQKIKTTLYNKTVK